MEIHTVKTETELKDAYKIRFEVFVDEQKVPTELEIDELEDEAIHCVGYHEGQPIAASRLRFVDNYAKMERICVAKSQRGKGYGKDLLLYMEDIATQRQYHTFKLHAQVQATAFYETLGYQVVSEEFMDAGIPHVTMVKQIG
ncbi:GNAT family N-acetyltransferase [Gracilibacillus alcaliphilus]|uniref:GNAT family N-acetyltransferase n=1 Tax=Gracilibacillus alcaliphilus TaxID=1401441 RepID=UPI00195C0387|nr:GNAT family N-acetyltransferase [Gracilibacillus alcaliphilus]MBM7675491.1 putative GNAT family N-acyltransferase [Gracilibacillus alcaliphilus]